MHPVIQFLLVVAASIGGLVFAVNMFPKEPPTDEPKPTDDTV